MSRPAEYENGAQGTSVTHPPVDGGVQDPPSVYHPQQQPAPSYEEYADPAAAHGWQNAYDETARLPAVVPDALIPRLARGVSAALDARERGVTLYLEHGLVAQ